METESGGGRSLTIGVDLGDRASCWCALDGAGEVLARGQVINEKQPLEVLFQQMPPSLVALEVGTPSAWVGRALEAVGASFADPVRGCPSASAFAIACLLPHLSWSRAGWKFYPVADEAKGVGEGPKAGPTRPPPTTQPEPPIANGSSGSDKNRADNSSLRVIILLERVFQRSVRLLIY